MAPDLLQIAQSVPQQFTPYIILFGLIFFLVSLTKISWKIRLAAAFAGSVGINLYMPSLLSPFTALVNSIASIGASVVLIVLGLVLGRKKHILYPTAPKQSKEMIRNLEIQKAKLAAQLNSVHGNIDKERQISVQINAINDQIRKARARLGLPV